MATLAILTGRLPTSPAVVLANTTVDFAQIF
jgi:hypothetical protein